MMNRFNYSAPGTVREALTLLGREENAIFLAGGTDLVPLMKYGLKKPSSLISLDGVPELGQIEKRPGELFIGSMSTLGTLISDPLVNVHFPVLSDAARHVASPQIRTMGTIGGNILQDRRCIYYNQTRDWRQSIDPCFKTGGRVCHQVPGADVCRAIYHSDLAPALLALDALVEFHDQNKLMRQSLEDFLHAHISCNGGVQSIQKLITGFVLPYQPNDTRCRFVKHSSRSAIDFPIINGAVCCRPPSATGTHVHVKIIVGAVAPEPMALEATQNLIAEQISESPAPVRGWIESAVAEIHRKSALIRDTGVSMKNRQLAFGVVGKLLEEIC